MNRLILVKSMLCLALGYNETTHGQGTIVFNNLDKTDGQVFVYTDFWSGTGVPLNQDLNFQLAAGPPGAMTIQRSWLLRDGTAKGINVGPGLFADPSHSVILLPGIAPGTAISVEVDAWSGDYDRLGDAENAGAGWALGRPFIMFTGSAEAPPASLVDMPRLNVRGVPEPQTLSLMISGGIVLLYFCRGVQPKRHATRFRRIS